MARSHESASKAKSLWEKAKNPKAIAAELLIGGLALSACGTSVANADGPGYDPGKSTTTTATQTPGASETSTPTKTATEKPTPSTTTPESPTTSPEKSGELTALSPEVPVKVSIDEVFPDRDKKYLNMTREEFFKQPLETRIQFRKDVAPDDLLAKFASDPANTNMPYTKPSANNNAAEIVANENVTFAFIAKKAGYKSSNPTNDWSTRQYDTTGKLLSSLFVTTKKGTPTGNIYESLMPTNPDAPSTPVSNDTYLNAKSGPVNFDTTEVQQYYLNKERLQDDGKYHDEMATLSKLKDGSIVIDIFYYDQTAEQWVQKNELSGTEKQWVHDGEGPTYKFVEGKIVTTN